MGRFSILLVLVLLKFSSALAAGDIVLRSSVQPEKAWLGQRVILQIDVLGSDGWTQITRFDDIEIPGAYLMRTDSQGTRLQETIDGISYSGQRYEFSIYPQAAGAIEIPVIGVELTTRPAAVDTGASVRQAQAPAVTILSKVPAGAENIRGLVSTTQLTAGQNWQSPDETPEVGDALQRTVSLQAVDISGMAFTPLEHEDIAGVGIYPAQPTVQDTSNRGSLNGSRTEVVTYVFEQSGEVQIPDIEFSWWNLADSKLEHVVLPGRLVRVVAGAGSASGARTLPLKQLEKSYLVPLVIMFLLLVYVLYFFRKALLKRWVTWRVARKESEKGYFQRVVKSIRSEQPAAALRNIMRWLDQINDARDPAQLDVFVSRYGDTRAKKAVDQLLHSVAVNEQLADPAQLLDVLSTTRRNWRQARKQRLLSFKVLPGLNPEK
jgi:hypothetical protein